MKEKCPRCGKIMEGKVKMIEPDEQQSLMKEYQNGCIPFQKIVYKCDCK